MKSEPHENANRLRFKTHRVELHDLDPRQLLQHMAAHEAGHAVVGLAHGISVVEIDIRSDPVEHVDGGVVLGGIRFDAPNGDMNELARERPTEMAVALMAGICSEEVIFGCHLREGWAVDFRILRIGHGWIDGRPDLPPEVFRYLNDAYDEVKRHEATIRKLANVLLDRGRLTGDEVAHLVARQG